jgi:hypothetical protein
MVAEAAMGTVPPSRDGRVASPGRHLMERKWLDRFIALLPAKPTVLDIGCGPGEPIALYLLE